MVISISFFFISKLNSFIISHYIIELNLLESNFFIFIILNILIGTDLSNDFKSTFPDDSHYLKFNGYNGPNGLRFRLQIYIFLGRE
jgi:hypothetical protein